MKTTIRLFCAFLFMSCSVFLYAQDNAVPKDKLGKWNFTMEDPQSGGSFTGLCTIAQNGNDTKATFDMGGGGVETTAFRPNANGKFYADITIEGYQLGVSFDLRGENVICELDAGSIIIPLEMKRAD